jgi:transposase-like protein
MESVAEEPLTVALASTEMPRFADGTTSMQELLRQLAESIANEIMSAEAVQLRGETGTSRNGCRDRKPIACVGTLDLRIPKTRRGTFFPDDVPVRHQRVDRALVSAVAEMHAAGTSTRKVQHVAQELGAGRLPEDQAGAMAQSLGEGLEDLRTRPPGGSQMPCIWLDATYCF